MHPHLQLSGVTLIFNNVHISRNCNEHQELGGSLHVLTKSCTRAFQRILRIGDFGIIRSLFLNTEVDFRLLHLSCLLQLLQKPYNYIIYI